MSHVNHVTGLVVILGLGLATAGCGSSSSPGGSASMDELASASTAQSAAEQKKAEDEASRQAEEEAQRAAQAAVKPPRTVAGRPDVGEGGYFTAIVGARRRVLNEADRWPWLQAVQHFKAEQGRLPKDHEEFMSKVVEPLEINLGYKEENQEFFYDPNEGDWGELYVVERVEEPAPK